MERIDCSGLPCPQPVINTKKKLDAGARELEVTVDNDIARQNILKLFGSYNYQTTWREENGRYFVHATATTQPGASGISAGGSIPDAPVATRDGVIYFITSDVLGDGDRELGRVLMRSLLYTLSERPAPKAIIMMNSGVQLACEGSQHIDILRKIESAGTEIIVCGTCLDFYELKDKLRAGNAGNMYTALEMLENSKVIKI